jgi:hypothetical protein
MSSPWYTAGVIAGAGKGADSVSGVGHSICRAWKASVISAIASRSRRLVMGRDQSSAMLRHSVRVPLCRQLTVAGQRSLPAPSSRGCVLVPTKRPMVVYAWAVLIPADGPGRRYQRHLPPSADARILATRASDMTAQQRLRALPSSDRARMALALAIAQSAASRLAREGGDSC